MENKNEKPEEFPMPPIPREFIPFVVWVAALAAGYDASNQARTDNIINLFAQVRFAVESQPDTGGKKPPN